MGSRLVNLVYLLLASLLNATTALTIFYATGVITTIGSSLEIPYILSGFVLGSASFPVAAYMLFSGSRRNSALSALIIPVVFVLLGVYINATKVVGNIEMFLLSFLAVAGDVFVVSVFSLREGSNLVHAIGMGLGGLFVMTIMLIVYAALFDSHMPLIILSAQGVALLLLPVVATHSYRGRRAAGL